jgi:hypothetical protein
MEGDPKNGFFLGHSLAQNPAFTKKHKKRLIVTFLKSKQLFFSLQKMSFF